MVFYGNYHRDCDVLVVPYNTPAEKILRLNPDGIMLSNGPGDPKEIREGIEMIKGVIGKVPIFGICLGHQLGGLSMWCRYGKIEVWSPRF